MGYHYKVEEVSLNSTTGHHSITLRIIEDLPDGMTLEGVLESFGVEGIELNQKYSGDGEKWAGAMAKIALSRHQARQFVATNLIRLKGKKIPLDIS